MNPIFNKVSPVTAQLEVSGVDFDYTGTTVFRCLDVHFIPGAVTAVLGSNGAGKSTLLSLLAGVVRPKAGTIRVHAADTAFAVQRSQVTDTFPITAAEAVMMGRWRRLGLWRRPARSDHVLVAHWLREFGLTDLRHRTLGELSGGQRQRVLLAQAFAQEAKLLLLDEPTTGLDADTRSLVIAHLRRLAEQGTTVIAATHDAEVTQIADHRIDLDEYRRALG
jgi:zinc/manganese transport system ATP-binding protein